MRRFVHVRPKGRGFAPATGCWFQPPIFFSLGKENGPLTVQKKSAFGGLSEYKIPQSLYAGVVFADIAEFIDKLYRTAGDR